MAKAWRPGALITLFLTLCPWAYPAESAAERMEKSWAKGLSRIDAAWVNSLKRMPWVTNDLLKGSNGYFQPKPLVPPKAPNARAQIGTEPLFASAATGAPKAGASPSSPALPPRDENQTRIKVPLYGDNFEIPYATAYGKLPEPAHSAAGLADHWAQMAALPHSETLAWIKIYQERYFKNDYLLNNFLTSFTAQIYPGRTWQQRLLQWFLGSKLGYQSRIVYNDRGIYIVYACDDPVYGLSFFTMSGHRYVMLDKGRTGSVYTYPENYPGADHIMSFRVRTMPTIPSQAAERTLRFDYQRQHIEIPVKFDVSIPNYFTNYPQTGIQFYGEAPLSPVLRKSLGDGISPYLAGKSEIEIANFLLALTQKSFSYMTDDQQFGREKWNFAEETLFYPYSDCEDRSVFFIQLMRLHTRLPVVFLEYPGHMAAAVKFSQPPPGDQVVVSGETFTVCDPTYIGARLGMAMPQFKAVAPKVVAVRGE